MTSRIIKGGVAVVSAIAVAVLTAPTAGASGGHHIATPAGRPGGPPPGAACSTNGWVHACFVPKGDVIWVKDTKADGYHADVPFWWDGYEDGQTCHNRLGKKAGWTYCDGFAKMIPEHDLLTLWPMEADGDEDIVPKSGGSQIHSSTS